MNDLTISTDCIDLRTVQENNFYNIDKTSYLEESLAKNSARSSAGTSIVMRPRAFGKPLSLRMRQTFFGIQQNKAGSPDGAKAESGARQSLAFALKHGRTAKQPGPARERALRQARIARRVKRLPPQTAFVPACGTAVCGRECALRAMRLRPAVFTSQQPSPLEV